MGEINTYRSQTVRLSTRNYDEGGPYFVTICTVEKRMFFGTILKWGWDSFNPQVAHLYQVRR
jgi:hypothetical protein